MEKPKIVSMKDALDLPQDDGEVPELPGSFQPPEPAVPSIPVASLEDDEEHPPEVPPERIAPRLVAPTPVVETPVPAENPASTPEPSLPLASVQPSAPPIPETTPTVEPVSSPASQSAEAPSALPVSVASSVSTPQPLPEVESELPPAPVAPAQPPSGSPPWVEREPQTPTVAEAAKPIPAYPGVGRPRINSISQGTVSLTPPAPVTAPIRPASSSSTSVPVPAAGKLYDRPELDADRFAEEMAAAKDATPVQKDVVKEYRQAALPPQPPARPLTPEEERAKARSLATEIHSKNEQAGFLGKVKRLFGLR